MRCHDQGCTLGVFSCVCVCFCLSARARWGNGLAFMPMKSFTQFQSLRPPSLSFFLSSFSALALTFFPHSFPVFFSVTVFFHHHFVLTPSFLPLSSSLILSPHSLGEPFSVLQNSHHQFSLWYFLFLNSIRLQWSPQNHFNLLPGRHRMESHTLT